MTLFLAATILAHLLLACIVPEFALIALFVVLACTCIWSDAKT